MMSDAFPEIRPSHFSIVILSAHTRSAYHTPAWIKSGTKGLWKTSCSTSLMMVNLDFLYGHLKGD